MQFVDERENVWAPLRWRSASQVNPARQSVCNLSFGGYGSRDSVAVGTNAENDQHADINLYAVAFLSSDDPASWTPAALRFMCLCICGPSVAAWNRCMRLNLKHWPQRAIVWVRSVRTQLLIAGNVFPSCCQHAANHQEHTDVSSAVEFAQVRAQTLALLR